MALLWSATNSFSCLSNWSLSSIVSYRLLMKNSDRCDLLISFHDYPWLFRLRFHQSQQSLTPSLSLSLSFFSLSLSLSFSFSSKQSRLSLSLSLFSPPILVVLVLSLLPISITPPPLSRPLLSSSNWLTQYQTHQSLEVMRNIRWGFN